MFITLLTALAISPIALSQVALDSACLPWVKSVQLHPEGAPLEAPVITLGEGGRLRLEFDLLRDQPLNLEYTLRHCDAHWQPDGLEDYEFFSGFATAPLTAYEFSFTTLRPYIHYRHTLPEPYSDFTHSGNYLLTVHLAGEPDSVVLTRRLWVSEQAVGLGGSVVRPYDGIGINHRQELDALVDPSGMALNHQYLTLVAQQNGRLDNQRTLPFTGYDRGRLAYRQRPENIFAAGNNFRFFDAANLRSPMYNIVRIEEYGGEYYAILRPEPDRSTKPYIVETNLNGGFKINAWDRRNVTLEAEYVWVNFSLPMAQPFLDGSVHIVGALTDWRLDSTSRMDYNPQYRAYTARLLLKQGYYAYQLLFLPAGGTEATTARLEGDHWLAPNRYTLYLYLRQPNDRADRLLAVSTVATP